MRTDIIRRRGMMGGGGMADQELKYICGYAGKSYINLGYIANLDVILLTARASALEWWWPFISNYKGADYANWEIAQYDGLTKFYVRAKSKENATLVINGDVRLKNTYAIYSDVSGRIYCEFNGVFHSSAGQLGLDNDNPLLINSLPTMSVMSDTVINTFYSCEIRTKITVSTTLYNLVPYLHNGRPCLKDTINNLYFYNVGQGEFGFETMDGTIVNPI